MQPQPLDLAATEQLTAAFAAAIKQHYLDRPRSNATVLEVLNALAAVTAFVVAGTEPDQETSFDFFLTAFHQQLDSAPMLEGLSS